MATGEKVGLRIKSYREQLKMSPADLAAKSGVDEALVLAVEAGEVLPALGILTKLSRALGQRLGTFMDDQFKPDPIVTRAADVAAERVTHTGKAKDGYTYHSLAEQIWIKESLPQIYFSFFRAKQSAPLTSAAVANFATENCI